MAAYRQVYDSRHLQADYQEPGSAPEPYVRQSSIGYLFEYWLPLLFYFWLFTLSQKKLICNPLPHATWKCTTLTCEVPNFFIWLKVCIVLAFSILAFSSTCVFSASPTEPLGRRGQYWPTLDRLPPNGVCSGSRGPLSFRWISINKWHDILKTVVDKTNRRPDVAFRHFSSQYEVLANHFPPEIINYCSWLEELRHRLLPQTLPSTLLTDVVHTWTSSRLHVWHTNRLRQQHRRTYLSTFNSSLSMVVVISADLPTEHSLFHTRVPLSATEVLLWQDRMCGTVYRRL